MEKREKERAVVVSQEKIATDIYSLWLRAEAAVSAKAGQFISMYTNDSGK